MQIHEALSEELIFDLWSQGEEDEWCAGKLVLWGEKKPDIKCPDFHGVNIAAVILL